MRLAKFGALAITTVLVVGACSNNGSASGGGKTIKIGTELPMSGAETANGEPTANGVKLAIKQANAKSTIPGYTLDINVQDDAVNGAHDPQQGATNMHTLVADTTVVGVVGPFNSSVAQAEIPISNAAGLLQCSPANTKTGLTYPPDSAQYRPTNPDKINYVRTRRPGQHPGPGGRRLRLQRPQGQVGLHPRRHRDLRRRRRRLVRGRVQEGRRHGHQA